MSAARAQSPGPRKGRSTAAPPETSGPSGRSAILAALLVFVGTLVLYAPLRNHGFTNFDTPVYITNNPVVTQGWSWEGAEWAFTTFTGANWHPLTWLSIMLDVELFGLDAGAHHGVSAVLHAASSGLLLWTIWRATGALAAALVAASLFAVHPLHVEAVAWGSQRKDVLSTLFLVLTLALYVGHARAPSRGRLAAAVSTFTLGLLAKPMLVSVPFLLGALDLWPLRRLEGAADESGESPRARSLSSPLRALALEKIAFLVPAAGVALMTLIAQGSEGAIRDLSSHPLPLRLANAAVSTVGYLWQTLWPTQLAVFYPYPETIPALRWGAAFGLLLAITAVAWRLRRTRPEIAFGWFWFVVSLLPVIGIVQVGEQAHADRYTYVPHIGLFTAVAWGAHRVRPTEGRWMTVASAGLGVAVLLALCATTRTQLASWRSSTTLYEHALRVTTDNAKMHFNLAATRFQEDDAAGALEHYVATLRLEPDYRGAHYGQGVALGRGDEALRFFERETERYPEDPRPWNQLAAAAMQRGEPARALSLWERAVALAPESPVYAVNAAAAGIDSGELLRAEQHLARALARAPNFAAAHSNRGRLLAARGELAEAERAFARALELDPRVPGLRERYERVKARREQK